MIKKDLVLISNNGDKKPFSIEIGTPFKDDRCWCCPVNIPGLHDIGIKGACGEDSIHSLCVALGLVKRLLKASIQDGSKIYEVESECEWSIDVTMEINLPTSQVSLF